MNYNEIATPSPIRDGASTTPEVDGIIKYLHNEQVVKTALLLRLGNIVEKLSPLSSVISPLTASGDSPRSTMDTLRIISNNAEYQNDELRTMITHLESVLGSN